MAKFVALLTSAKKHFGSVFFRTFAVLLLVCIFFITGGGISQNEKWKINDIKVATTGATTADSIIAIAQEKIVGNYYFVYSKGNSYIFPAHEIELTLLQTFPRLATVAVHSIDNHTILIEIAERKPFGLWCGDTYIEKTSELSNCWFIDNTGFVFDHAPTFSENTYQEVYGTLEGVKNGSIVGSRLPEARFNFIKEVKSAIEGDLGVCTRMSIKDNGEYGIIIQSSALYPIITNSEVRFKDEQDARVIIKNLLEALPVQFPVDKALKKKLLYMDLRFDKKVFFGFEN